MNRPPEFDTLLGEEVPVEERDRLRRVHDQLLQADAPPELTPALRQPPRAKPVRDDVVAFLPRRRAGALLSLAAALALVAFLGGYLAGHHAGFSTVFKVHMHATAAAPGASALVDVGQLDKAGNWPLLVHVHHLKPLARGGYYEMYITRDGKRVGTCGTFRITGSSANVRLNAPYELTRGVGWVVVSRAPGAPSSAESPVLTT